MSLEKAADGTFHLRSSNTLINQKPKLSASVLIDNMMKSKVGDNDTFHTVLLRGLVELCKAKPSGEDAVKYLGEWLIENNPSRPRVVFDEQ